MEDSIFEKWFPKYQLIINFIIVLYSSFVPALERESHVGWAGIFPFMANIIMTPLMFFWSIIFLIITIAKIFKYKKDPFWVKGSAFSLSIFTFLFSYYGFYIICLK